MNRLFRVLASCLLAVVVALGSVSLLPSPASAQTGGDIRINWNIPTQLFKNRKYYIPETTETAIYTSVQNKSISQKAKIAFFYGDAGVTKTIPANTKTPEEQLANYGGSKILVQNISDLDNNNVFLTVSGIK
ncbi:hypothetical protein NIES4074_55980 [Cylindrospermum sp. NIES-4074]|nr:hypothetical protein NIES4074_55980 [Cylindrospermum sp. NIES-4074]